MRLYREVGADRWCRLRGGYQGWEAVFALKAGSRLEVEVVWGWCPKGNAKGLRRVRRIEVWLARDDVLEGVGTE